MTEIAELDKVVGKIAGAIYTDISRQFPHPPLLLVPALTFKVRKVLENITGIKYLTDEQKSTLADDIQVAIVPILFSYEVDADVIEQVSPIIKDAALKMLHAEDV